MERTLHIVMFTDQHPETLGGMQTSVQLQRKYLERAGHRVTIVAPALRGRASDTDAHVLTLPTVGLGPGEYGMTMPTARTIRTLVSRLRARGVKTVTVLVATIDGVRAVRLCRIMIFRRRSRAKSAARHEETRRVRLVCLQAGDERRLRRDELPLSLSGSLKKR